MPICLSDSITSRVEPPINSFKTRVLPSVFKISALRVSGPRELGQSCPHPNHHQCSQTILRTRFSIKWRPFRDPISLFFWKNRDPFGKSFTTKFMRSNTDQVAQKSLIPNRTAMKMLDIDLKLILKVNIQISPPSLEAFSSGLWARTSWQPSLQQIKDSQYMSGNSWYSNMWLSQGRTSSPHSSPTWQSQPCSPWRPSGVNKK